MAIPKNSRPIGLVERNITLLNALVDYDGDGMAPAWPSKHSCLQLSCESEWVWRGRTEWREFKKVHITVGVPGDI